MDTQAQREATALGVELEAKLLERLIYEWKSINYTYFDESLRLPVLRLSETHTRLGQWHGADPGHGTGLLFLEKTAP